MNLKRRRFFQVLKFGWIDSKAIADEYRANRIKVYRDILHFYKLYNLWSFHYRKENLWILPEKEKVEIAQKMGEIFRKRDEFVEYNYANRKFLSKWTKLKYESSPALIKKRGEAYRKRYNIPDKCVIQYGVVLLCEHFSIGELKIGEDVLLARNVDIDYTGGLEISNHVSIAEGVKILTHAHDAFDFIDKESYIPFSPKAYKTPLVIKENVSIGCHAIIMPGVKEIGENSMISAGAIVTQPVPPNVVVAGNPAKVVYKLPKTGKGVFKTHLNEKPI